MLLSGVGLGAYVLYNEIPAGADPLGPDNVLGFTSGLLTGTGSLMTGRWMVVCKSPLTGGWGDANCGGYFAPAIKQCGYDGIFFTGIAEKPVYLLVNNKGPQLKDASHVWGKDATESEEILIAENTVKKTGGSRNRYCRRESIPHRRGMPRPGPHCRPFRGGSGYGFQTTESRSPGRFQTYKMP